jgi:hypothetical protein
VPAWLTLDSPPPSLLLWVGGSVLFFALASNALWLLRETRLATARLSSILLQAGRFAYYLGVPYLVLGGWPLQPYQGLLAPITLGLAGFDASWPLSRWLEAGGTGASVGLLAVGFVVLAWRNANRRGGATRLGFSATPAWVLLVDGLYLQVHWAFYRGALAVLLGDLYAAVFWGLVPVALEWLLNPFWRQRWHREACAGHNWLLAVQALVTSLLFLLAPNLWLCLAMHWALSLTSWALAHNQP